MTEPISTIDDLIAAMGGIDAMAAAFDERAGTVQIWKHRKRLPARKHEIHKKVLDELKIVASPEIWSFERKVAA
jgi:hypothetical protein